MTNYRPSGHNLYWVYAYWADGENFDTTKRLREAEKILREFVEEGADEVHILYGNEEGAFTHLDAAESAYRKKP